MDVSILIISDYKRKLDFKYLYNRILNEIKSNNISNIEILFDLSNKNIQEKKEYLLEKSNGRYYMYIYDYMDFSNRLINDISEVVKSEYNKIIIKTIINEGEGDFHIKNDFYIFKKEILNDEMFILKDSYIIDNNKECFSILLTAYNTQDFIEECLDSIERQTYFINNNKYEILLGIDGCNDTLNKVKEIKDKYRNLNIFMMYENKGTYITTNTLLDYVNYDNVIRFDTDDIMEDNMIEEVVNNKKDNDLMRLGCVDFGEKSSNNISPMDGVIYFRYEIMNIAGGYVSWLCGGDSEFIYRVRKYVKISNLNLKLFKRRIHKNSLTNKKDTRFGSKIREDYKKILFSTDYNDVNNLFINKDINEGKIEYIM
jgi:hypothetical protein